MLREEELNLTPGERMMMQTHQFDHSGDEKDQEKDFSFIQNRVPSPLNNNFLLSAEQSRHARQPSEGFISILATGGAAQNLMNQEEFRNGYQQMPLPPTSQNFYGKHGRDQDQEHLIDVQDSCIQEQEEDDDDDLETSKLTLFTHEGLGDNPHHQQEGRSDMKRFYDHGILGGQYLATESDLVSNNFNYSESAYPNYYQPTQSIGGYMQQQYNGSGSFIALQTQQNQLAGGGNSSRGSGPMMVMTTNGRESAATPFYYDENSLMNLSSSPNGSISQMMRTSNLTRGPSAPQQERIINSTKLNHRQQQNQMGQILEDRKEEEQDESMLPPMSCNLTSQKHHSFTKQQDEWILSKKINPLELPLQRNTSNDSYKPFSPLNLDHLNEQITIPNPDMSQIHELFSRGNPNLNDLHFQQNQQMNQDMVCADEDIEVIKKKLDFSRLSSFQNLSQANAYSNQIMVQQNNPNSFMFQTYQSQQSNNSAGADTHHYSTFQNNDNLPPGIPFEELLQDHMKQAAAGSSTRNHMDSNKSSRQTFKYDQGVQVENRYTSEQSEVKTQRGISPPSKQKLGANSNTTTRPPLLKPQQINFQQPQQKMQINTTNMPIQQVEIVQQNCINIFQSGSSDHGFPQNLLQSLQVPPQSRTNSTNSYTGSMVEPNHLQPHQPQNHHHFTSHQQQQYPQFYQQQQQQPQKKAQQQQHITSYQKASNSINRKISIHPNSDTPREPSSIYEHQQMDFSQQSTAQQQYGIMTQRQQSSVQQQYFMGLNTIEASGIGGGELASERTIGGQDSIQTGKSTARPKKIKVKKSLKDLSHQHPSSLPHTTSKTRASSKPRPTTAHGAQAKLTNQSFLSKTMILSKDKIQPASSQQTLPTSQTPLIEAILKQNQLQIAQKLMKQTKQIQKVQVVPCTQQSFIHHPQSSSPTLVSSGKSIPNSNQSSTQTSFLTLINGTGGGTRKGLKKAVTTNKKSMQIVNSKDVSQIQEERNATMKKVKKKTASISRQQMLLGATQQLKTVKVLTVAQQQQSDRNSQQQTKCNTQRSLSRSKPRAMSTQEQPNISMLFQQKKNSIIDMNNKENIKPVVTLTQLKQMKAAVNQSKKAMIASEEQMKMHQTHDNFKLFNAQELIKEITMQQQRLSVKNITQHQQNSLFATLDNTCLDIAKRNQTEQNNHHIKSMQTFDTSLAGCELDPYNMLMTIDTQRQINDKKSILSNGKNSVVHTEVSQDYCKKGQQQQSSNVMQKMQSPYNSKTMKNKFSNVNKQKKSATQTMMLSTSQSNEHLADNDNCKRCNELIHILKNTRFMAR